jgi:hypothetical protein
VGDHLLRLYADWQASTPFDHGQLFIGQNVDGSANHNVIATHFTSGTANYQTSSLDNIETADYTEGATDAAGGLLAGTAYVFHTSDPVQVQLTNTGGTDPTAGYIELHALVLRHP